MKCISAKQKLIQKLTIDKNEIYTMIQQKMLIKANTKIKMTPKQISGYRKFFIVYDYEIHELNKQIVNLRDALKKTQAAMLKNLLTNNISGTYGFINEVECVQNGLIGGLEKVISIGEKTLEIL